MDRIYIVKRYFNYSIKEQVFGVTLEDLFFAGDAPCYISFSFLRSLLQMFSQSYLPVRRLRGIPLR